MAMSNTQGSARFQLGRTLATPGALLVFEAGQAGGLTLDTLMGRHLRGEWGELCAEDTAVQDASLEPGAEPDRLMSVHMVNGIKLWIITEWDRSATTVLLPEEY